MKRLLALVLVGLAALVAVPLIAQDQMTPEEQKSWFVEFVESRLSTPERQIRLSNIDGVLSQDASIREITISDKEGVWLRIENAAINWDQAALFTGRLFVRTLTADSIAYIRNPVPSAEASLPSPEAGSLEVPDFPVAIILEKLSVPKVTFGTSVFGLGSEIAIGGALTLDGGSLDANLDITRLDGPGGHLVAKVGYRRPEGTVDVGVTVSEPPNGILVNLLNIEGRPDIALSVNGSGPVADLKTTMTLDAGGQRALAGTATITQRPEGFAVAADLRGPIAELVAEPYRPFFGSETTLTANGLVRSAGGISISALRLAGGQLSLTASAETTADGFLRELKMRAEVADPAGGRVLLPLPGGDTSIDTARLDVDYGTAATGDWSANVALGGFANAALSARDLSVKATGVAANLEDAASRRVTFNADGLLSGVVAKDPDTQAALGDTLGFGIAGLIEGGKPLQLAQLRLAGKALDVSLAGVIDNFVFDGDLALSTASLTPFSGLAGRDLSGALSLAAKGTLSPLTGGFDLTLDGTAKDLAVDEPALDRTLRGEVQLGGRVARTEKGVEATAFRIANRQVQLAADGTFATGIADFRFTLDLADLSLLSPNAAGPLSVVGTAKGQGAIALDLTAKVPAGKLAGRNLVNADFGFTGTLGEGNALSGRLTGAGALDGFTVSLAGNVNAGPETRRLDGLRLVAGPTELTGDIAQGSDGLLTGAIRLNSPNVSTAAALLLINATGAASADITLSAGGGSQQIDVTSSVTELRAAGVGVGSAEVRASITDAFGVPQVNGRVSGRGIAVSGISIATLDATAKRTAEDTSFTGAARLTNGTTVNVAGALAPVAGGYRLALERATLAQGKLTASLARPVTLAVAGDSLTLDAVRFDIGGGRVTASGTAGRSLDLGLEIDALPLAVANAVSPGLGLGGTIDGTVRITGSGAAPQARFALTGAGINAAALGPYGVAPLAFTANGSLAGNTITLERLSGQGAGGLRFTASGRAPLAGRGLALSVSGTAPLALANRLVADRGGQFSGNATADVDITGSLAAPRVSGRVSTSGSGYIDPALNLRLVGIEGSADLSADRLTITSLTAGLATGGRVAASGAVGLGAGNPADMRIRLDSARYADGNLFVATVSGDLSLTGRLGDNPLLSGRVAVEKADISVPENLGGSASLIDVRHVDPPKPVSTTLARAKSGAATKATGSQRPSALQLDVAVDAPNQIHIRGRGLDVEVGGSVRLTGSVNDIRPVGAFTLNRGRLSILGQRITFTEGTVTLVGDLDPYLNLVAQTQGEDITVLVNVTGRVSEVQVEFASTPSLPQDEVLARLLFKRSMGELSPLQLARLAGAAAELAGGGGSSLTDSLRARAGLENLDVVTDEKGNVAVQAGAYVRDNIYLGVQAGADGNSRVSVDLDITDNVKARASTGVGGDSSVGVFYEADY